MSTGQALRRRLLRAGIALRPRGPRDCGYITDHMKIRLLADHDAHRRHDAHAG